MGPPVPAPALLPAPLLPLLPRPLPLPPLLLVLPVLLPGRSGPAALLYGGLPVLGLLLLLVLLVVALLLMVSVVLRYVVMVSYLLARGASLNTQDRQGRSAAMLAVKTRDPAIIQLLVKHKNVADAPGCANMRWKECDLSLSLHTLQAGKHNIFIMNS